jgi:hypothetical protein
MEIHVDRACYSGGGHGEWILRVPERLRPTLRRAGKAEGHAEGEVRGRAHALFAVLTARRIEIPDDLRQRVAACTDLALLDQWLARAATAQSSVDVENSKTAT